MSKNHDVVKVHQSNSVDVFMARFREMYSGHEELAIDVFRRVIAHQLGIREDKKPVGSYMVIGPSGSGKSYFWECIAKAVHGPDGDLLYINGSEYQHAHEIARLIGAPPGYLGHKETDPILSSIAILKCRGKSQITTNFILFDEIDKSHTALKNLLLGVMERGDFRTGDNKTVDMRDCFLAFTANSGDGVMHGKAGIGIIKEQIKPDANIRGLLKDSFSTYFLNRIDHFSLFTSYDSTEIIKAVYVQVKKMVDGFEYHVEMTVAPDYIEEVAKTPLTKEFGMRDLIRKAKHVVRERFIDSALSVNSSKTISAKDWKLFLEKERESSRKLSKAVSAATR